MAIEHYILKSFVKERELFSNLHPKIKDVSTEPVITKLIQAIDQYYQRFPTHDHISKDELVAFIDILWPMLKDKDLYVALLQKVYDTDTSDSLVKEKIKQLKLKDYANQIAQKCIPALNGEDLEVLTKVESILTDAKTALDIQDEEDDENNPFAEDDLEDLLDDNQGDGLRWRMNCLNDDLGQLPGGTLGHIFMRPDAGKTSFIHSEMSHFCKQFKERGLGETVMWFNNEEKKAKIKLRWWSAVTGMDKYAILSNKDRAHKLYEAHGGTHLGIIDRDVLHIEEMEALMIEYQPRIVVIDVADKCVYRGSTNAGSDPLRLKAIYDKLREVSKRCNAIWKVDILTTAQADAPCENKKWLYQTNLDGGKTGKAGAFDYIIGIGKLHNEENVRYLHCCKNKQGDQSGRHVVNFNPMIAHYTD